MADETEVASKRPLMQTSVDTRLLFDRLKTMKQGEIVTYDELSKIIEDDVRGHRGRGYLNSARKMVASELKLQFDCVRNVGLKCLTDSELANSGKQIVKRIRGVAKRGAKRMASVQDFDSLSKKDKVAHNAGLSITGAILQALKPSIVQRIEDETEKKQTELPLAKTLALFGG